MANDRRPEEIDPTLSSMQNDIRAIFAALRRDLSNTGALLDTVATLEELIMSLVLPLSVQNGGTGANNSLVARGSLFYFSATGVVSTLVPGTAGQALITGGAGADPAWATIFPVTVARGGMGADHSLTARGSLFYFSATGVVSALAPGTSGKVLTTNGAGANPTWETPFPATNPAPLTNGGTGINASAGTRGSLFAFSADGVVSVLGPGTAGQYLVSLGGAALPAWTDQPFATRILDAVGAGSTVDNTTTKTSIYSYTVPANMLIEDAGVRITLAAELINNTSGGFPTTDFRYFISWAGADRIRSRLYPITDAAASRLFLLIIELFNNGSTTAQQLSAKSVITEAQGDLIVGPPASLIRGGDVDDNQALLTTTSVDQSANEDIEIFIQFEDADANIELTRVFARTEYIAQDI